MTVSGRRSVLSFGRRDAVGLLALLSSPFQETCSIPISRQQATLIMSRIDVAYIGFRSPYAQGGVEKHVAELADAMQEMNYNVLLVVRSPYHPKGTARKLQTKTLWAPRSLALEAIVHTFLAVLYCAVCRPRIVHIHAIGPGFWTPLARLFGLTVVFTHHGFDYDREKWGRLGRFVLKLGELLAVKTANVTIAVSPHIQAVIEARYGVKCHWIPNGFSKKSSSVGSDVLTKFGIQSRRYVISVGRIVPEKRQVDLIHAFRTLADDDISLVLVGGADHESPYCQEVESAAQKVSNVVLAGLQTGVDLAALYENADAFALPSSHEGFPIALLEALSYGLPVAVSNIPAHQAIPLDKGSYAECGDADSLAAALKYALSLPEQRPVERLVRLTDSFQWQEIARRVSLLYKSLDRKVSS